MTGEKNRYSSVEKLWKMDDETLKTPKHDEMVLWLLNVQNAYAALPIVKDYHDLSTTTYAHNRTQLFSFVLQDFWKKLNAKTELTNNELIRAGFYMATDIFELNSRYEFKEKGIIDNDDVIIEEKLYDLVATETQIVFDESTKILEEDNSKFSINKHGDTATPSTAWVLGNLNDYIAYLGVYGYTLLVKKVGVNNIKAQWREIIKSYHRLDVSFSPTLKFQSEIPIMTERDFLVGYWDIVISPQKKRDLRDYEYFAVGFGGDKYDAFGKVYIEVKPKIASFGATLRQLRTYQEYEPDSVGSTYLFTDDLRFKDAFESQGIRVVTRNGDTK